jgi:hypothetical protein
MSWPARKRFAHIVAHNISALISLQEAAPSSSKQKKVSTAERQKKRQKRKADEDQLGVKRKEMDKAKVSAEISLLTRLTPRQIADAVKRYSYLLGQTELFKHFVDIKVLPTLYLLPTCKEFIR